MGQPASATLRTMQDVACRRPSHLRGAWELTPGYSIYIYIYICMCIYISISQDSLRKVIWNLLQQTSRVLFITISGLLTLIAWGRWVTQTLWPQRILGEWNKLFKGISNEEAAPSRFCSHHFGMISPEFWLRMDETGSLTYEYLSLRTRNVSNFKYVHMLLKIVQHLMEPLVVGHLSSHVVTLSCHHVQDPKQVGDVRLVIDFFPETRIAPAQVDKFRRFKTLAVHKLQCVSWSEQVMRVEMVQSLRPMTSTHYSEENPKLGNPACWATCRPQEQWTTRWRLHHNLPQLPYPRTPASKLHACGSVMIN